MKYVFIGPDLLPYTGQSLAFHNLVKNLHCDIKIFTYGSTGFAKLFRSAKMVIVFSIYAFLKRNEIDSIYITSSRTKVGCLRDILILLVARVLGIRVVNHLHGADFVSFRNSLGKAFRRVLDFSYNSIDTSIVLLPSMACQYQPYGTMNIEVVGNGVEDLYLRHVKKIHNNISYLSNIMYTKGIIHLVDAVIELNERYEVPCTLCIAGAFMGDNEMSENDVKDLFFSKIGGRPYINYLGTVFGQEKSKLLSESEVFVLPTFYPTEAQPLSIIEAMVCENVIISTEHNYIPDMISDSEGVLVASRSTTLLIEAIRGVLGSEKSKKRIGTRNRLVARKNYSLDNYVHQTKAIIERKIV